MSAAALGARAAVDGAVVISQRRGARASAADWSLLKQKQRQKNALAFAPRRHRRRSSAGRLFSSVRPSLPSPQAGAGGTCPTDSPLSDLLCESPGKDSNSAAQDVVASLTSAAGDAAAAAASTSSTSTSSSEPVWQADKRALYLAAAKPKMYAVALIPVAVGAAAAFASGGGGGTSGVASAAAATTAKSLPPVAAVVSASALFSALASASLAFLAKALTGSCLVIAWLNLSNDAFDHSTGVDELGGGKPESVVSLVAGGRAWPVHAAATLCLVAGGLLLASALGYDVSPSAMAPEWLSEAAAAARSKIASVAGSVSATAASAVSGAAEAVASVASSSSPDSVTATAAAATEGGGVGGVLAPVASLFHGVGGGSGAAAASAPAATAAATAATTPVIPLPPLTPPPPDPRPARLLAAAVAAGYLYQGPPFRLSRKGLGEPLAFVAFGPLATVAFALAAGDAAFLGGLRARVAAIAAAQASSSMSSKAAAAATAAATAAWPLPLATPAAAAAAVAVGMTTAAVLFCSHFHQIEGDRAAGKLSPLVRLGAADGARVLASGVAGVYAFVGAAAALGALPPLAAAVAALASLPKGVALAARAAREGGDAARIRTLKLDALGWHSVFGMALALGLVLPRAAAAVARVVLGV